MTKFTIGDNVFVEESSDSLVDAARRGDIEAVNWLLDIAERRNTVQADYDDSAALFEAVKHNHCVVAFNLIHASPHAARADCRDGAALLAAVNNNNPEIVRMLLNAPQHPAKVCRNGTELLAAVNKDESNSEIVDMLLNAPLSVDLCSRRSVDL